MEKGLPPKKETILKIGMSDMQKKYYAALLQKDIEAVNGGADRSVSDTTNSSSCCASLQYCHLAQSTAYCQRLNVVHGCILMSVLHLCNICVSYV